MHHPRMALSSVITGKIGRHKRTIAELLSDNRLQACQIVRKFFLDESIPLEKKMPYATQLVLKIMPEKHEVVIASLQLSVDDMNALNGIAERHIALRESIARTLAAQGPQQSSLPINSKPAI